MTSENTKATDNNGSGPSASAFGLAAMGVADLRATVTTELARIKDDIGGLHEKINAVKDTSNSDKVALITQLNQEFASINRRFSDFNLALQQLMGNSEHAETTVVAKLEAISREIDTKILQFKLDLAHELPEGRLVGIDEELEALRGLINKLDTELRQFVDNKVDVEDLVRRHVRRALAQHVEKSFAPLEVRVTLVEKSAQESKTKLSVLNKKVAMLAAKVGTGIAVLGWLLNLMFGDSAKDVTQKLVGKNATSVSAPAKAGAAAVDGTGNTKADSAPSGVGHPR